MSILLCLVTENVSDPDNHHENHTIYIVSYETSE